MAAYDTLVEALQGLRNKGYDNNFNLEQDCIFCPELNLRVHPEYFTIDEFHRFEGMSDPSDNAILYAITSDTGIKGVFVNAYGIYSDPLSDEMIAKLSMASASGS